MHYICTLKASCYSCELLLVRVVTRASQIKYCVLQIKHHCLNLGEYYECIFNHSHSHFSFADGAASPETKLTYLYLCVFIQTNGLLVGRAWTMASCVDITPRSLKSPLLEVPRPRLCDKAFRHNVISTVTRTCCGCVVDLISNPHVAHNITCQHDLERFLIDVLFMPSLCDLLFAWLPCIMKSATTSTNIENFNYIEN